MRTISSITDLFDNTTLLNVTDVQAAAAVGGVHRGRRKAVLQEGSQDGETKQSEVAEEAVAQAGENSDP